MHAVRLLPVPHILIPCEVRLLTCTTPAGFPSPAADDMEEPIDLASWLVEHPAACYVMRVAGHSMGDAGIHDGDYIVVNRAKKARHGHVVVALVHGDRTLKRLKRRGERYWLCAEAPGYADMIVDENVEIWGVVDSLARRLG